jgi:hypothetical protein
MEAFNPFVAAYVFGGYLLNKDVPNRRLKK